jgi:hypothetical protein
MEAGSVGAAGVRALARSDARVDAGSGQRGVCPISAESPTRSTVGSCGEIASDVWFFREDGLHRSGSSIGPWTLDV